MPQLAEWDSFYEIVGSAAGALVGLQFVVMTLIAQAPVTNNAVASNAASAFGTPTIVHLSTPLFLAALIRAPWHGLIPVATLCGLIGLGGTLYAIVTAIRMIKQQTYSPVFEDWLFHLALPIVAYVGLVASAIAIAIGFYPVEAPFGVGAAVLLLLLVGIHNAYDNVAYHVYVNLPKRLAEARDASRRSE
jgi:hypothetical protein